MVKTKHIPHHRIFKNAAKVESLMAFLILHGYKCILTKEYEKAWLYRVGNHYYPETYYISCEVKHPIVTAMFCNKNNDVSYQNLSGYISIESVELFNKWSQVPIIISLDEKFEVILDYLKKMETKEFQDISASYDTIRDDYRSCLL